MTPPHSWYCCGGTGPVPPFPHHVATVVHFTEVYYGTSEGQIIGWLDRSYRETTRFPGRNDFILEFVCSSEWRAPGRSLAGKTQRSACHREFFLERPKKTLLSFSSSLSGVSFHFAIRTRVVQTSTHTASPRSPSIIVERPSLL